MQPEPNSLKSEGPETIFRPCLSSFWVGLGFTQNGKPKQSENLRPKAQNNLLKPGQSPGLGRAGPSKTRPNYKHRRGNGSDVAGRGSDGKRMAATSRWPRRQRGNGSDVAGVAVTAGRGGDGVGTAAMSRVRQGNSGDVARETVGRGNRCEGALLSWRRRQRVTAVAGALTSLLQRRRVAAATAGWRRADGGDRALLSLRVA